MDKVYRRFFYGCVDCYGDVDVSLLDPAMENAKDIPSFAGYSEARELVDTAVRDITDGNSNIKMSLIKWQHDINLQLGQ